MKFKRGDTFAFSAFLTDENKDPIVVTADNVICQVRTKSEDLIDTLNVIATETPGNYEFKSPGTSDYPIGELEMDIQITKDGNISSSQTVTLEVERDVSRNGTN